MTQLVLPLFPSGATEITPTLSFSRFEQAVTYFHAGMPIFSHDQNDRASFRCITAQLHVTSGATQAQLSRAFGVPLITIKRAVKQYRSLGIKGFFAPRVTRGTAVLTDSVLEQAQSQLNVGQSAIAVAIELGIKPDTFTKAIRAGRLHALEKKDTHDPIDASITTSLEAAPSDTYSSLSSKSERSHQDSTAPMGRGASHVTERVAASLGELTFVAPKFEPALDVPFGGVLFALPALLALGLLDKAEDSLGKLPDGYYGLDSLLMLLTFMALARLQTMESLRYSAPGEWGKLLGLDRIPDVRTLRTKVKHLSADGQGAKWAAELSLLWMNDESAQSGWLYVDGHTRVYHGSQTKLPRHYVARQKLCLRATVDFWVNAMDGQPFFVVNKAVDPGLIKVIEEDIVPRLMRDVPNQPSEEALAADPYLHRFTIVFDREGYSPPYWSRLKEQRIAALSYHKFPSENWAADEFMEQQVTLINGQVVTLPLAERGTCLSNGLWVREIRTRNPDGHQTAIITTHYRCDFRRLVANMVARWSQENYFRYTRQHFGLDRLAGYCTQEIPDPIEVVNPAYRALDGQVRSANGKLSRSLAVFGALNIEQTIEPAHMEAFTQKKAALKDELDALRSNVIALKATRKATERRIKVKDLPEDQRFKQLSTHAKHFVDAIKMLAYRGETAMANSLREKMARADEARTLLRELYTTEADLLPDLKSKTLTVRLHHLAQNRSDQAIALLCEELNETKTVFPRTELLMIFEIGKPKIPVNDEISPTLGSLQNP